MKRCELKNFSGSSTQFGRGAVINFGVCIAGVLCLFGLSEEARSQLRRQFPASAAAAKYGTSEQTGVSGLELCFICVGKVNQLPEYLFSHSGPLAMIGGVLSLWLQGFGGDG